MMHFRKEFSSPLVTEDNVNQQQLVLKLQLQLEK